MLLLFLFVFLWLESPFRLQNLLSQRSEPWSNGKMETIRLLKGVYCSQNGQQKLGKITAQTIKRKLPQHLSVVACLMTLMGVKIIWSKFRAALIMKFPRKDLSRSPLQTLQKKENAKARAKNQGKKRRIEDLNDLVLEIYSCMCLCFVFNFLSSCNRNYLSISNFFIF